MDNLIKVYIRLDDNNVVVLINSDIFLNNTTEYICIDEGIGDKYAHAQGHYLKKGLVDEYGRYNYKFNNGNLVEIAEEEKPIVKVIETTSIEEIEERLSVLENAIL